RASATVGGVAADERTGLAEHLAQVLHQQEPGLDVIGVADPVDGERDRSRRHLLLLRAVTSQMVGTLPANVTQRTGMVYGPRISRPGRRGGSARWSPAAGPCH